MMVLVASSLVVAMLGIFIPPASAFVDTRVCGWNGDPTYKSDLSDQLYSNPSGTTKVGYSQTSGRHYTEGCDYAHSGYYVRVKYAQWRWNAGSPSVCDLGSNGAFLSSGGGYVNSHPFNTSCTREGWTHSQVGVHGIAIAGTWVDTGLYSASEA